MKYTMHFIRVLLVLLCFNSSLVVDSVTNLSTDETALFEIRSHIMKSNPDNALIASYWPTSAPACGWIGVSCESPHGRVVALNISNMSIGGAVPPEIGSLLFLSSLDLSVNSFRGQLPTELSRLRDLQYIKMDENYLSGDIPIWLGTLQKLKMLSLSVNNFTGTIPLSLFNLLKLTDLYLSYNSLQGTIDSEVANLVNLESFGIEDNNISGSIPLSIYKLSSLKSLVLSSNRLSGSLPDNMCDSLPNLKYLYFTENELEGQLPLSLGNCSSLDQLDLSTNKFRGRIPRTLGNLTNLKGLYIGDNNMEGDIPTELSNILGLEVLSAYSMGLTGTVPPSIFNMSSLIRIRLYNNSLSGILPSTFGLGIANLEILNLWGNNFSGVIPYSICNASKLTGISLAINRFSGSIPYTFGYMSQLKLLQLDYNEFFSESSTGELSFLSYLTNCRHLRVLGLSHNPLISGTLPTSIGNFSTSLQDFDMNSCKIEGQIPREINNLTGLITLSLEGNELEGSIPTTFGKLKSLQGLFISHNNLQASIPYDLCHLKQLHTLDLSANNFQGRIPTCFTNLTSLRNLNLSFNNLNSTIPSMFWSLSTILKVDLSSNSFIGNLSSEVSNLKVLFHLDVSRNKLSGALPDSIGGLIDLLDLSVANNNFHGHIPTSFGDLITLQYLDLSDNDLTGTIPKSLEALKHMIGFNVSFNKLEGQVPTGGCFENFSAQSYMGNYALCGSLRLHMPPCKKTAQTKKYFSKLLLKILLPAIVSMILMALCVIILIKRRKQHVSLPNDENSIDLVAWRRVSRIEIVQATEGFNETNLLGVGAFGSVYKGVLSDEMIVAIKVFNMQVETGFKSFDVESEIFRNVRHRNLVKVVSSCSDVDFKALVLEFMPKGSLDKWLYVNNYFLDINERLNIVIDVAAALEYLHYGYSTLMVHCDLKPSNVLLDKNKVAHLSDFGISKLFEEGSSMTETVTLATIGYMAPEYGSMGIISRETDVYSYGILVMETFTRTKPTNERFGGDFSLKDWVKHSLHDGLVEVADANLLKRGEQHFTTKLNCISSILAIACNCSSNAPGERGNMKDVLAALEKIRQKFLKDVTGV